MEKDPANVIPIDVMFDIQKKVKAGCTEEEILSLYSKQEMKQYVKAYISRVKNIRPIIFPS